MVALDKKTGKPIWQSTDLKDAAPYCSVVAADVAGVRQYITQTQTAAVGVRASDGKLLWRVDELPRRTAVIPTPIVQDNHVFFTAGYGAGCELLKLEPRRQGRGEGDGGVHQEPAAFEPPRRGDPRRRLRLRPQRPGAVDVLRLQEGRRGAGMGGARSSARVRSPSPTATCTATASGTAGACWSRPARAGGRRRVGSPSPRRARRGRAVRSGRTRSSPTASSTSATTSTCSATTSRRSKGPEGSPRTAVRGLAPGPGASVVSPNTPTADLRRAPVRPAPAAARRRAAGEPVLRPQVRRGGRVARPTSARPDDLARLPFTTKTELAADQAAHPPYGTALTLPGRAVQPAAPDVRHQHRPAAPLARHARIVGGGSQLLAGQLPVHGADAGRPASSSRSRSARSSGSGARSRRRRGSGRWSSPAAA